MLSWWLSLGMEEGGRELWLETRKGDFDVLVMFRFFTWTNLLYGYLLNFIYTFYALFCRFLNKIKRGEWSVMSSVDDKIGNMRTKSWPLGLSNVETTDEHSWLSQWTDWGKEMIGQGSRENDRRGTGDCELTTCWRNFYVKRRNTVVTGGDVESFTWTV